ncbi:RidA family protein [Inquilinus sp. CA228]|uniref:RidA family protein n=1 Tax=Inquilinus sp. CA228 TaxID=3455609 RepID=UPI003F8CF76E
MSQRTDLYHAWEATQKTLGYSQAVRAGDTIYVAGTASLDAEFNALDPGDLPAQMRNIYRRIGETLAHFPLGFGHVVRETMVVTDMDGLMPALAYRKSVYGDGLFPASTTVEVKRLFAPGLMIEIEVAACFASGEG